MIDFTEIPNSMKEGDPDAFEKFCADYLVSLGYEIITGPSRGPDGGIDLKVKLVQKESNGDSRIEIKYLASCKHFATSKKSVGVEDETSILDRIKQHDCDGFLGLYTTIASTPLQNRLIALKISFDIFYDKKIESTIVGFNNQEILFARYFPISYGRWKETYFYLEPVKLFEFYLENQEDKFKDFINICFKKVQDIIKPIRSLNSFEDIFCIYNIKYIVSPILDNTFRGDLEKLAIEFKDRNKNFKSDKVFDLDFYLDQMMPNILFNSIDIEIVCESFQRIGFKDYPSFRDNMRIFDYFIFPNYFFCSTEFHNYLQTKFDEYKEILT